MLNRIVELGESISWLANILGLLGLSTPLFAIYKWRHRMINFFGLEKYKNIKQFLSEKGIVQAVDEKSIRIAILDDQPSDFPVEYIKNKGLNVSIYDTVSLANYKSLFDFDILFLDMKGLVKENPENGALELLKRLKASVNSPYVVAVSKATFDPTVSSYFKMADDTAKKPIDEMKFDALWDEYISGEISIDENANIIDNELGGRQISSKISKKAFGALFLYLDKVIDSERLKNKIDNLPANFNKDLIVRCAVKIRKAI